MPYLYILDGKTPIVELDTFKWGTWFASADRVVKRDKFRGVRVSTVFLGLDYSNTGEPPILFETMVFGGPLDQKMSRCATWEEAEAMHEAMCDRVRSGEGGMT